MSDETTRRARRLRSSMTGVELRIWLRIRGRRLDGWKFRRQHPIGPYVVDFYCRGARLVVEINGPAHDFDANWAYDRRREAWLEAEGYRVLTIPVHLIDVSANDVAETILAALDDREADGYRRRPLRPAAPAGAPSAVRTARSRALRRMNASPQAGRTILPVNGEVSAEGRRWGC